ncbi:MAG: thiamine-phosphate kinase [Bacteroidales bacterium]|nr:thiamine-phosphate kinase [Candidatus Cacconaster scatequi]
MDKRTEIAEIGKRNMIEKLLALSGMEASSTVIEGKGSQCSCSHVILLEGVDFDLVYTPLRHLGYKAVLYALGDLYASLRAPEALSVNLGLSKRFCYEDVEDLWQGMVAACGEHGVKRISLDLNPSVNGLCISLSALGTQKKSIIDKVPAPANMDLICLTGHVGAAYMGLHILEREKVAFTSTNVQPELEKYKAVLGSYLSPEIKKNIVSRFLEAGCIPSKGFFVSKGLGAAVLQLVKETGLGAKLYLDKIPISSQTFAVAEELNMDAITAAMNGGDDYKFIFTVPIEKHEVIRHDFQDYDIIGHTAKPEVGAVMVTPEGAELEIKAQGY